MLPGKEVHMLIKETIIRSCCQDRDILKSDDGKYRCIHCGQIWLKIRFLGDNGWDDEFVKPREVKEGSP